jgi:hypothetical protein|tara:strand:- start:314 stop:496 length:183 start_codon:yes stop_codon:yes gene_type:complete
LEDDLEVDLEAESFDGLDADSELESEDVAFSLLFSVFADLSLWSVVAASPELPDALPFFP